jgi:hypothetical protein
MKCADPRRNLSLCDRVREFGDPEVLRLEEVPRPARVMPGTGCCSMMEPVKLTAPTFEHACAGVLMLATIG